MSSLSLESVRRGDGTVSSVRLYALRRRLSLGRSIRQASLILVVFALGAFAQLMKWAAVLVP
ncbi:MAG TPA: hypothetical protein VG166_04850 [Caulobacteraceae bacterium]|jgi:hypothetical protein|nr:hypothetical protein [Caulobacteraceae bacterium]